MATESGRLHIAVLTVPGYGHVTPPLGMVAELVRRGHRVTFATGAEFVDTVAATGADPVRYDFTDRFSSHDAWEALCAVPSSADMLSTMDSRMMVDPPDLIAFDSTMWIVGRAVSSKWGRPSVQLCPCFASNEHFSLTARMAAVEDPSEADTDDDYDFIGALRHFLTELGLPDPSPEGLLGRDEERKVVFLPREFQFHGETFGPTHVFAGPGVAVVRDAWTPPASGLPVVLISLGTSEANRRPEFFRDCARLFTGQPWHVVMTLGGGVRPAELGPLPDNIEAHRFVPHPAVLRHASAFVTAAGMGSVLEALHCGTPLVMVPQHSEQKVNAERVVELGLGRTLPGNEINATAIYEAVQAIHDDKPMRQRLSAMRHAIHEAGGATTAADAIETWAMAKV
ncbi:MAG TPA: macrolide family glycosyltransferase [Pseudonocardiaceae bacterium]|nr:macrolide family glycosyltransferase [Pseudonocardiaceae bacterium]